MTDLAQTLCSDSVESDKYVRTEAPRSLSENQTENNDPFYDQLEEERYDNYRVER